MLRAPVTSVAASWGAAGNGGHLALRRNIKGSLGFIMNAVDVSVTEPQWLIQSWEAERGLESPLLTTSDGANPAKGSAAKSGKPKPKVRRTLSYEEKRRSRECKMEGCENYIINKGLCFRHGVRFPRFCRSHRHVGFTYLLWWCFALVGREEVLL
jgi:hypothetical protein